MKTWVLFFAVLIIFFVPKSVEAQCNFKAPVMPVKLAYACRQVVFDNIKINGQKQTVAYVKPKQSVKITTNITVKEECRYCPSCIVQLYWGINNYFSICAVSFYGYENETIVSEAKFDAPEQPGLYYVTLGGTLDYECQNNKQRPPCDPSAAFAVLIVGTPDPETKVQIETFAGTSSTMLRTSVVKNGCFGNLQLQAWYQNDQIMPDQKNTMFEVTQTGTYKAVWKNCAGDSAVAVSTVTILDDTKKNADTSKVVTIDTLANDLETQLLNNDKLVLENLQFELKSAVLLESSKKELDKVVRVMTRNPNMRILLEGHTDYTGNPKSNQKLSEQRVENTKKYLVENGIDGSRIETKGWGDKKPLNRSTIESERRRNRRVEITILRR